MNIRGIAHRGYPIEYPENTMSSFQAAIKMGFTHMELDVHLSKDGVPVVMHDHTIDRMTDGQGQIRHYTFQELRAFSIEGNEKIPSLEEVLQLAKDKIIVSIELKKPNLYNDIEEKVLKVVQNMDMMNQVYFISFDYKSLAKLRKMSSEVALGPLVNKMKRTHFRLMEDLQAEYLAVRFDGIKEKYVRKCEKQGIQLVAWTVNTKEQMIHVQKFPSILSTTDELEKYRNHFYPQVKSKKEQLII
ncbi:glycerophosphodiester phosphodiesterase [Oceanobacillus bengalensis]|uniref:Glycerophosphodiester phosphodiesterase n=1 Tax=Oceanobacillus bengalensis TaxID=1435466 RepID=A0A494YRI4_9BACI|nr:glycerophosphodiester phosphodiesterase family protein [Oceanobacillus bengalensis]RKQ11961.1 glycerophosphodiester phosphodiesterase [Oceanobacillus bengalensis]